MQQIYRILWSLAIFLLALTAVVFSFGIILIAVGALGLLGVYRYYLKGRGLRKFKTKPYSSGFSGEIIDVKAVEVDHKTQVQDPEKRN